MTTLRGTVDSKLWIKYDPKLEAKARKVFNIKLYDEKKCHKCEYRPERHSVMCDECPVGAYEGEYRLWRKKEDDKQVSIGLPIGRPSLIRQVIGKDTKLKLKDERSKPEMKNRLKFIAELRKHQVKPVAKMIKKRRGVLEAPPRAGKTVMAINMACRLGLKTLILARQYDWLKQFEETIYGTKNQDGSWKDKPMTNVRRIEEKKGRKIAGFCKDPEEMKKYNIVLATYQSFISKRGKKRLKKMRDMFGLVVIDECQNVPADKYLQVISELEAKYMVGLSGTPERKDKREILTEAVLGTVKAVCKVESMVPEVQLIETEASTSYQYKQWHSIVGYLTKHAKRNKQIVKEACRDIKAGRHIMIPVERTWHIKELVNAINHKMGKRVVEGFEGKVSKAKRDEFRDKAKKGKLKGIVGMRKMVSVGLNIPILDTLYVIMPISNPPNFKQETARIRTVMEGKPKPIIKHFVEDFGPTKGCFRTCWWQTYVPEEFTFTEETQRLANKYMSNSKRKEAQGATMIF